MGAHILTVEVEDIYFLIGLSRWGDPISLTGSRCKDITTRELIDWHCVPGTGTLRKKIPIRAVTDSALRIVLFTMQRVEASQFRSMVARFVSWNISPPTDSKVFHWSEWFKSRTNEWQRLKTLPRCRRYLECDASIVTLCTSNQIKHTNTSNMPECNLLIHVSD